MVKIQRHDETSHFLTGLAAQVNIAAFIWALGLHGVVTALAMRKSDGFDSHKVQSLNIHNRHEVSDG